MKILCKNELTKAQKKDLISQVEKQIKPNHSFLNNIKAEVDGIQITGSYSKAKEPIFKVLTFLKDGKPVKYGGDPKKPTTPPIKLKAKRKTVLKAATKKPTPKPTVKKPASKPAVKKSSTKKKPVKKADTTVKEGAKK